LGQEGKAGKLLAKFYTLGEIEKMPFWSFWLKMPFWVEVAGRLTWLRAF
jgi:hypothetical protein